MTLHYFINYYPDPSQNVAFINLAWWCYWASMTKVWFKNPHLFLIGHACDDRAKTGSVPERPICLMWDSWPWCVCGAGERPDEAWHSTHCRGLRSDLRWPTAPAADRAHYRLLFLYQRCTFSTICVCSMAFLNLTPTKYSLKVIYYAFFQIEYCF